jgi:hypothetical protein
VSLALALLVPQPLLARSVQPPDGLAQQLTTLQASDARVSAVAFRLSAANAELCPVTRILPGFNVHQIGQYAPEARPAAVSAFGLGRFPVILTIAPRSHAEAAGLRVGDSVTALAGVDTRTFFPPPGRKAAYQGIQRFEAALEAALDSGPVELAVTGPAGSRRVQLIGDRGCASRVQVVPSTSIKGSADGTYVQISSRLVEFVRDDDELALVIAHEMAHNVLQHRARLRKQGVPGGLLRSFGKNASKVRSTEAEADYYALYMIARAGFDPAKAPAFWGRLGNKMGLGLFSSPTHPGWSSRAEAARLAIAEIQGKRAAGKSLQPEPGY